MQLVPNRFLFRIAHPCAYVPGIPDDDEHLFDLGPECRLDEFMEMDGGRAFADVRMAWNEGGIAVQVEVKGREGPLTGDAARPRLSDGISLWIDTRDSRTSHRASRFCHQFHLLATGGGPEKDEPAVVQAKINRALGDAPMAAAGAVALRLKRRAGGYKLTTFLSAGALAGFDPEQSRKLGLFYVVRDNERGEQASGPTSDLPYSEDPTLWSVLELKRESGADQSAAAGASVRGRKGPR